MLKPGLIKRYRLALGSPPLGEQRPPFRRYSVVFFSTSVARAAKVASVLSVAGIRVHHASTSSEVRILLRITRAGVVLIDLRMIGAGGEMLRELAADFPEACTVVLSPFGVESATQLYVEGAWEVVVEPARFVDLFAALESAHELHQELTDPVRLQSSVDAIMKTVRRAARGDGVTPGRPPKTGQNVAGGGLTIPVIRRRGPVH
jgi:DNA-binding NarL/FixJ family response regulator